MAGLKIHHNVVLDRIDKELDIINITNITYNSAGDMSEILYESGNKVELVYDSQGDLDHVNYYDVDSVTHINTLTMSYDSDKNILGSIWS